MTYDWIRLTLAVIGILPPLAFVVLTAPSTARMRPLPSWLTWAQSLALTMLYAGVIGASLQALKFGRQTPTLAVEILLFGAYGGLAVIRYRLLAWWIQDWRARKKGGGR